MMSDFQKLYVYDPLVNSINSQMNSERSFFSALLVANDTHEKCLLFSQINIGVFTISTLFRYLNLME